MNGLSKKIISGVLSVALSVGCFAGSAFSASAVTGKYGDVNNDGKINSSDALEVLSYSVGNKSLDSDSLIRADVTADKKINSSDALDILKYSVGIISSFKAEESVVPTDKNEILAIYSSAVSQARSKRPSYRINSVTETKDVTASMSGLLLAAIPKDERDKMIQELIDETQGKDVYSTIVKQGSTNSLNNLPVECALTDASALKSITLSKNSDGNYVINIAFKDETNPKASSSALVKALGAADRDTLVNSIKEGAEMEGVTVTIDTFNLKYTGCSISCVVNPDTKEFVSLNTVLNSNTDYAMSVMGITTKLTMTTTVTSDYTDFGY